MGGAIKGIKLESRFGPQTEPIIGPLKVRGKSTKGKAELSRLKKDGYKHEKGVGLSLDNYWLIKPRHFNVILGHDNVGKSYFALWLATIAAKEKKWRFNMYMGENEISYAYASIAQMYMDKKLENFSDEDLDKASKWVDERFAFIDNDEPATYQDIVTFCKANPADAVLVDPYNSLIRDIRSLKNLGVHEYDYQAASSFRSLSRTHNMSVWVTMHAVTEAGRKLYKAGHEFEGYQMPPSKSDVEGGNKWANRCDDFLIVHRLLGHNEHHTRTEVHIRKIKYTEKGGRVTPIDSPVHFRWNGYGFEDEYGNNPLKAIDEKDLDNIFKTAENVPF